MLIHSAKQLVTVAGGPQRGKELGRLNILADGAVAMEDGQIVAVGASSELRKSFPKMEQFDASSQVVMPGFVDAHTHVIWAGDRAAEFEQRLEGKSYLQILEEGGGILSTVRATREASKDILLKETRARLRTMFEHGSTTIEAKTGYGLELDAELKMLDVLVRLDNEGPWELAITFLGAHAIPQEYAGRADEYTEYVSGVMLPKVKEWWERHAAHLPLPFVDVFCETGAFSLEQSRRILEAAKELGFPLKIHADEFDNLGGTALAARLGAVSVDHVVAASAQDIQALAESDTVAVALPGTPFGLATGKYAPAHQILEAGGILALGSDLNPGTSWCESMQFAIALACRTMKLTPAQAIAAATINAAAAVGRAGRVGSIEVGKQADLVILDVPDYRHLGYRFGTNLVSAVVKKGILYPVKGVS